MRRWLCLAVLFLCASGNLRAQVPGSTNNDTTLNATNETGNTFKLGLKNPTQAGNIIVCGVGYTVGAINTPTDDKSNTWHQAKHVIGGNPGNGTEFADIWYANNVAASTQVITFGFTAASIFTATCGEYFNISTGATPVDVTCGTSEFSSTGTSISVPCGSMTLTAGSELAFYFGFDESGPVGGFGIATYPTGLTAGTGFTFRGGVREAGIFSEVNLNASSGALNPAVTVTSGASNTDNFDTVGVAFKNASAGSGAPAGLRIINYERFQADSAHTSYKIEFPCAGGNFVAFSASAQTTNNNFTAMTDSASTTYTNFVPTGGSDGQWWYANVSGLTSANVMTMTHSAFTGAQQNLYCISGAANPGFDTSAFASGSLNSPGTTANAPAITPNTSNGVILGVLQMGNGPEDSVSSPVTFDNIPYTGETDAGFLNSGDGSFHYYNPNTSAVNVTYHVSSTQTSNAWGASAIAIKAPASSQNFPQVFVIRP